MEKDEKSSGLRGILGLMAMVGVIELSGWWYQTDDPIEMAIGFYLLPSEVVMHHGLHPREVVDHVRQRLGF